MKKLLGICLSLLAVASVAAKSKKEVPTQPLKVSFAVLLPNGNVEYIVPAWTNTWVRKNAKKYSNIQFSQDKAVVPGSYLIVFSDSKSAISGYQPVTHVDTSTSTTPISGSGTATSNYGTVWNYTYDGTMTTTTTTRTTVDTPYTIQSKTLYATAFDSNGGTVTQRWHVYSSQSGGDPYNSLGYNLGSALGAINARGRLLNAVTKDIEKVSQR